MTPSFFIETTDERRLEMRKLCELTRGVSTFNGTGRLPTLRDVELIGTRHVWQSCSGVVLLSETAVSGVPDVEVFVFRAYTFTTTDTRYGQTAKLRLTLLYDGECCYVYGVYEHVLHSQEYRRLVTQSLNANDERLLKAALEC